MRLVSEQREVILEVAAEAGQWQARGVGRRRSDQDRELQAVWEQIPTVACRGLCADACGPIDASGREKQRLRERGVRLVPRAQALRELADTGSYRCPALTQDDRCSVYADRPTVCRLWGAQRSMRCPHGCIPETGLLDDVVGLQLLAQSLQAGGDSGLLGNGPPLTPATVALAMQTPAVRTAVDLMLRRPGR